MVVCSTSNTVSYSRKTQQYVLRNTSAGGVTVNGTLWHVAHPNLPFGGVGESGTRRTPLELASPFRPTVADDS